MVTIAIFVMLTSVTLTSYPKFSNKLSVDLLAQDIALSLRQAQIFGSSVLGSKSTSVLGQTKIFGAYGVHFEPPVTGQPNYTYLLFADIDNDPSNKANQIRRYNLNLDPIPPIDVNLPCGDPVYPANECLQKFVVTGRNRITDLCLNYIDPDMPTGTDWVANCRSKNAVSPKSYIDVVFVRPNLDAKFVVADSAFLPIINTPISNVGIVLESPGGEYHKTIVVWKTGQISVE